VIDGLHWFDGNPASGSKGETTTIAFGRDVDQMERRDGE